MTVEIQTAIPKTTVRKVHTTLQQVSNFQLVDAQLLLRNLLFGPLEEGVEQFGEHGLRQKLGKDVVYLALARDVVDNELLVDDPVA